MASLNLLLQNNKKQQKESYISFPATAGWIMKVASAEGVTLDVQMLGYCAGHGCENRVHLQDVEEEAMKLLMPYFDKQRQS